MTTPGDVVVQGKVVAGLRPLCVRCLCPLNPRRIVHRCVRCGSHYTDKQLSVFEVVKPKGRTS